MERKRYGYVRVSSKDQNEDRQVLELRGLGIPDENIFMDKQSGKDFNRPSYQKLVREILQPGELLIVKSIDRLGRNYEEILQEWRFISKDIGCDIQILDMPLLNTSCDKDLLGTLISDIVLQLLSYVAENEREAIRQRQAEGIAAAKQKGVRFGRPRREFPDGFEEVFGQWKMRYISIDYACKKVGLPRYTFYRMAKQLEILQDEDGAAS